MSGFKALAGDPILHLGLVCGMIFVPTNAECDGNNFNFTFICLWTSHLINGMRIVMSIAMVQIKPAYPKLAYRLDFTERFIGFICVIVATFTGIQVQDAYFFYRNEQAECSKGDFKLLLTGLSLRSSCSTCASSQTSCLS